MNWIDFVLIALLLAAIVVGSKKGLVRELSAFVVFFAAVILTVNYIDRFAIWVYDKIGGSPMVSALISFLLLLGISYGLFKGAGWLFYKAASVKAMGKQDQVGGAVVGLLRGWVAVSLLVLLTFMLPMPESYFVAMDGSFLGRVIAKTVPLMYEGTKIVHPSSPSFITKMEHTLLGATTQAGNGVQSDAREKAYRAMYQIDRFFNVSSGT